MGRITAMLGAALFIALGAPARAAGITVALSSAFQASQTGRLIVFAQRLNDGEVPDEQIDFDSESPAPVSITATEVTHLAPGNPAHIDADADSYPEPFSMLTPGRYALQALLDRNHDYNYSGRGAGDLVSKVVVVNLPGRFPRLTLSAAFPESDELAALSYLPPARRAIFSAWLAKLKPVEFRSDAMTKFSGKPTFIHGAIALPPGYDGKKLFPTAYSFGGFGSNLQDVRRSAAGTMALMNAGKMPPMIWVFLDYAIAAGTHEFADSASNGPWETALITELIPSLEHDYRMMGETKGRFLTGHSSGGWAALWLQVRHPQTFGGAWPTSPDPTDFTSFFNADIYAPTANLYYDADGKARPLTRLLRNGFVLTMDRFARSEAVLGPVGGQMAAYDWTWGPRGSDGRPVPLFDRASGKIDPSVAAYWREHYDIARIIQRDWPTLKADLNGKIHLTVGDADTYYLDEPAHRLEAVLRDVGAKTDFHYLRGKGHNDLYERGGNHSALLEDIAREMYAAARRR